MSWLLIDIEDLLKRRAAQHEDTTSGAVAGAGTAGATTSANVGAYPMPFGPMLRKAPFPFDSKAGLDYAYGRRRRRRKS